MPKFPEAKPTCFEDDLILLTFFKPAACLSSHLPISLKFLHDTFFLMFEVSGAHFLHLVLYKWKQ